MKDLALKNKPSTLRCNICGSTSTEVLLTIKKPDRFEKTKGVNKNGYERKWIKCENCGIAFNYMSEESKQVVKEIESSYYKIDLGSESELQKKYDYVMNLPDKKSDNAGRVNRIMEYLKTHFNDLSQIDICDVGCGLGIFPSKLLEVSELQGKKGINIIGIEPDPISFSFAHSLDRFPVLNGFFPDVVKDKKFDLITLNKVLEHVPDPVDMVNSIAGHIRDQKGLAYIEVPCITNSWKKPPHDGSLGALHYNLYSINSLSSLIENAGLRTLLAERIVESSEKITVYAVASKI